MLPPVILHFAENMQEKFLCELPLGTVGTTITMSVDAGSGIPSLFPPVN
jgi:hypothetical protein